jgi:NADPH-dependent curcumin reductase CurA
MPAARVVVRVQRVAEGGVDLEADDVGERHGGAVRHLRFPARERRRQQRHARMAHERKAGVVEVVRVPGGAVGERRPRGRRAQRRADDGAQRSAALGARDGARDRRHRLRGSGEHAPYSVQCGAPHLSEHGIRHVRGGELQHELGEVGADRHAGTITKGPGGCKAPGRSAQSAREGPPLPANVNRRVLLKSRPVGEPKPGDFEIVDAPIPAPADGQILCRTIYLSLDPYMRGRMSEGKSYAANVELGQVMVGGTVSEVVESKHPGFAKGDLVAGYDGWQSYAVSKGMGVRKLDPSRAPISTATGVLGMPGMTAYVGLLDIGRPQAGETVVVSAASGAVGSAVGQIAKIKGCRAVGVAGSQDKCDYVVKDLGFDACVNYKTQDVFAALRDACPKGIDVYFDNVGGDVLKAVLKLINQNARIPLCGIISQYNATELPPGPNLAPILFNRALIKGFIVSDHLDRFPDFLRDCTQWVASGQLKYREDIVDGLDNAPRAFIGLLRGANFGKLVVKVGADPTRS